ncbi:MAG: putative quinol monooxygenase [Pseudomonadota bacterium]|jgi:quinol monooxygenase YgiN|nr:putative quinol monooxygenase [Pseudomonadota bacterium]
MIVVEGSARIPEGAWDEAIAAMETMIRASRQEAGCIDYAYSRDLLDPNLLRIIERWTDKAALVSHFGEPHMAVFRQALAKVGPQDLEVRMYDAEPEALPL